MKHLTRGGSGLLVTPRDDVHSLGITRLKTRTRSSYLNNPRNPTSLNRAVGDNSSVRQSLRGKCLAETVVRKD